MRAQEVVAVASCYAAHCQQEMKRREAVVVAACGLKRCVLEHREGRVRQVDGSALAPRHLLADENGLVYALLKEARIDSGTLQRSVDPGAAES